MNSTDVVLEEKHLTVLRGPTLNNSKDKCLDLLRKLEGKKINVKFILCKILCNKMILLLTWPM